MNPHRLLRLALLLPLLASACAHAPGDPAPVRATVETAPTAAPAVVGAPPEEGELAGSGWWIADPAALVREAVSRPAPADAEAEALLQANGYQFEADGTVTRVERRVIRILTNGGAETWGRLEVGYRARDGRPEVRARVVTADSRVFEVGADDLIDTSGDDGDDQIYEDARSLEAPLPAVAPGAVVEWVVVKRHEARFPGGFVWRLPLARSIPVRRLVLRAAWAGATPLQWRIEGTDVTPQVATSEEGGRLELALEGVAGWRPLETRLPWEPYRWPELRFTTGRSWAEVAAQYHARVEEALAGTDLGAIAREAVKGARSTEEKVDRLLGLLQRRVRYTSVALGDGALYPAPPAEVLDRGWGDCKDQATLLVGLLRALGIEAHVALLAAGGLDADPALPGLGMFDHAIARVEGRTPLWIDATTPSLAPGLLPRADLGRSALVIRPETTGLESTPPATADQHRYREVHTYTVSEDGVLAVEELTEAWGQGALAVGRTFAGTPPARMAEWAEGYVGESYKAKLVGVDKGEGEDGRYWLRIQGRAVEAGWVAPDEVGVVDGFGGVLANLDAQDVALPEGRTAPVTLPESARMELVVRYQVPAGFVLERPVEAFETRVGPVTATRRVVEAADGWLEVHTVLDTGDGHLSAEAYQTLQTELYPRLRENFVLSLKHEARVALEAGRPVEAVKSAWAGVTAQPRDALARERLAQILLELGLQEPAVEQAKRATALAPERASAWVTLGRAHLHDGFGRLRGPGYDRAGALAALREAVRLAPTEPEYRAELAIALEHRTALKFTGTPEELAEAATHWEAIPEDRVNTRSNYLGDLLLTAPPERIVEATEGRDDEDDTGAHLAGLLLRDGADAALKQLARLEPDPEARQGRLLRAGGWMLVSGRYEAAADLFEALGRETRDYESQNLARVLRTVRPVAELKQEAGPLGPVYGLLDAMVAEGPLPEGIWSSQVAFPEGVLEQIRTLLIPTVADSGLPPRVALEIGLTSRPYSVLGKDETGYRVQLGNGTAYAVVVPEAGGYRIWSFSDQSSLGRAMLGALANGQPDRARTWLGWFLDGTRDLLPGRDICAPEGYLDVLRRLRDGGPDDLRLAGAMMAELGGLSDDASAEVLRRPLGEDAAADLWRRFTRAMGARQEGTLGALAGDVDALYARCPDSHLLTSLQMEALAQSDRRKALVTLGDRLLGSETLELRRLGLVALGRSRQPGQAVAGYEAALAAGDRSPMLLNNLAWARLVAGGADEKALEEAQRSVMGTEADEAHAELHTLAVALAAADQPMEARAALLKSLRDGQPLEAKDWVVVGRIAWSYGLHDYAREVLKRADDPEDWDVTTLARRWLQALKN